VDCCRSGRRRKRAEQTACVEVVWRSKVSARVKPVLPTRGGGLEELVHELEKEALVL
jgi:hypothetical protein